MTETVHSRVLKFITGNKIVMADDVLIGMTPLSSEEFEKAQQFEYVDLHDDHKVDVCEVRMLDEDTRLALFDMDWTGVLVWRSDLGADMDLFDWEHTRIYRV